MRHRSRGAARRRTVWIGIVSCSFQCFVSGERCGLALCHAPSSALFLKSLHLSHSSRAYLDGCMCTDRHVCCYACAGPSGLVAYAWYGLNRLTSYPFWWQVCAAPTSCTAAPTATPAVARRSVWQPTRSSMHGNRGHPCGTSALVSSHSVHNVAHLSMFFKMAQNLNFEMCFAIGSQRLSCWGQSAS